MNISEYIRMTKEKVIVLDDDGTHLWEGTHTEFAAMIRKMVRT